MGCALNNTKSLLRDKEGRGQRCKGHTQKGHIEKVLNVMNFRIFRVFSGYFQGIFRVFLCVCDLNYPGVVALLYCEVERRLQM